SCIVDAIAGTISPASTAARASSRELARDPITASSESTRRIESSGHDEPGAHPQQTILPPERTGRGEGIESAGTAGRLEPEVGAAVAPRDDRRHLVRRHGDLRADRPRLLPCVPSGSTAATAAPALRATCTALSPRPPAPAIRTRSPLRSARRTRSAGPRRRNGVRGNGRSGEAQAVEPEDVVGAQHDVLREAAGAAPPHPPGVGTERVVAGATPPAVAARLVQVTAPRAPSNASSPARTSPATS